MEGAEKKDLSPNNLSTFLLQYFLFRFNLHDILFFIYGTSSSFFYSLIVTKHLEILTLTRRIFMLSFSQKAQFESSSQTLLSPPSFS